MKRLVLTGNAIRLGTLRVSAKRFLLVLSKDPVLRYQVGTKKTKISRYQIFWFVNLEQDASALNALFTHVIVYK